MHRVALPGPRDKLQRSSWEKSKLEDNKGVSCHYDNVGERAPRAFV